MQLGVFFAQRHIRSTTTLVLPSLHPLLEKVEVEAVEVEAVAAEVGRLCIPLLLVFPCLGCMRRATCESLQFFALSRLIVIRA